MAEVSEVLPKPAESVLEKGDSVLAESCVALELSWFRFVGCFEPESLLKGILDGFTTVGTVRCDNGVDLSSAFIGVCAAEATAFGALDFLQTAVSSDDVVPHELTTDDADPNKITGGIISGEISDGTSRLGETLLRAIKYLVPLEPLRS